MNGVFSPIAVGAAVAFCAFATAGQTLADEHGTSNSIQSAQFLMPSSSQNADPRLGEVTSRDCDSRFFPYLNYLTLTENQAFEDSVWVSTNSEVGGLGLTESLPNGSNGDESDDSIAEPTNPVTLAAGTDERAESIPLEAETVEKPNVSVPKSFVPKPISSIRLDGIQRPVSRSGEPLEVPDSHRGQSESPHAVEEHFTAAPWHRSHPPRNTVAFRHQPLYFEDPNLERCGESAGCLTEAVNIAHFAGRIPLTGYMMGANPPCSCVRALPDCSTCQRFGPDAYLPRPTVRSIATQAAATTGMIFLIP